MRTSILATTIFATSLTALAALIVAPSAVSAQSVDVSATIVSAIDAPAAPPIIFDHGEFRALQGAPVSGGELLTRASVQNSPAVSSGMATDMPGMSSRLSSNAQTASGSAVAAASHAAATKPAPAENHRSITVTWMVASNS
jgi:hypothetical protein